MNAHPYSYDVPHALQHFAGELVEKDAGSRLGLYQLSLRLLDDEGGSHIVYIAFGRGADAQRLLDEQYTALHIGQRYYTTATLCNRGDLHTFWMGKVQIKPDQRRTRFAPNPAPKLGLVANHLQQVHP